MATFAAQTEPWWFSLPGEGQLLADHFADPNFPKTQNGLNWSPPSNKTFIGGNKLPYDIDYVNGRQPLLECGFTHIEHSTLVKDNPVQYPPKYQSAFLVGDATWCNKSDPYNTAYWNTNFLAFNVEYNILNFEQTSPSLLNQTHYDRIRQLREATEAAGGKLALWAQALVRPAPLWNIGSSTYDSTGAQYWADMYATPGLRRDALVTGAGLKVSNPFHYHTMYHEPRIWYQIIEAHDLAKLLDPAIESFHTIWIESEAVDGAVQQRFEYDIPAIPEYNMPAQTPYVGYARGQTPASRVYMDALLGMYTDGFQHFDTGAFATNDIKYSWGETQGGTPAHAVKNYKGNNYPIRYPHKYSGFYNYVHLALWQMSQPSIKAIIEHSSAWLEPEYNVTNKANVWRTGDEKRISYACLYKEPFVRYKMNAAGTQALVLAYNPCNEVTENLSIRPVGSAWTANLTLKADWPTWGIITI